jgi:hypothetical protein
MHYFIQGRFAQEGRHTHLSDAATRQGDSSFSNHLARLFIIAHGDEGAMPQVPGITPFDEGDLANQLGFDPVVLLHFRRAAYARLPIGVEPKQVFPYAAGTHWLPGLLRRRYVDSAPIRGRRHLQESLAPFDQHGARRVARVLLQDSERALEISGCIR